MKKVLLLSLFSIFALVQSFAQWGSCEPNALYADSTFGVYPPPLSATNPDGGIPEKACQGQDYYFVWTMKIPETIETSLLTLNVDSIIVNETGAIINLPAGMSYAMNPQNGIFTPEDTLACITIYGAPEAEGTYDLKIALTIFSVDLAPFGGSQSFELPSALIAGADGNYFLEVLPSTATSQCFIVGTDDLLASSFSIRNTPNPFSGFTNIEITAAHTDKLTFRVYDLVGNQIHNEVIQVSEGLNSFEYDGSDLSSGIYIYTIEKDGALVSNKMIIN